MRVLARAASYLRMVLIQPTTHYNYRARLSAVQKHVAHAVKTDFDLETEVIPKRTAG
jgi:hypothetical protein